MMKTLVLDFFDITNISATLGCFPSSDTIYQFHVTFLQHPNYKTSGGNPNDMALIQIDRAAKIDGQYVDTISMAAEGDDFEGRKDCYITGWGHTQSM